MITTAAFIICFALWILFGPSTKMIATYRDTPRCGQPETTPVSPARFQALFRASACPTRLQPTPRRLQLIHPATDTSNASYADQRITSQYHPSSWADCNPCWTKANLTRGHVYRVRLTLFGNTHPKQSTSRRRLRQTSKPPPATSLVPPGRSSPTFRPLAAPPETLRMPN